MLDEVVTSSREYHKGEASGWDDFLENGKSDVWDGMKEQSKASLQYMSKKRIPLKMIKKMKCIGNYNHDMYRIERGCFADIRLEKVVDIDIHLADILDADIADLGRACPNLQKLDISSCRNITDVGLIEFSRYCHGLKDINMQQCYKITNAGLIEFSQNCRGLNKLNLNCRRGIVAGGVEGLSQHCRELQIIAIVGGTCTDADLLALSINCQQLQEIYLCQCHEVTDDGLIEMSKHLNKQFCRISTFDCDLISDRGLIGLSENCPHLKNIKIFCAGDNFTDDCVIGVVKNCTGLENIEICSNDWVRKVCMLSDRIVMVSKF